MNTAITDMFKIKRLQWFGHFAQIVTWSVSTTAADEKTRSEDSEKIVNLINMTKRSGLSVLYFFLM